MARRINELFIGKEYLNLEGRSIKHPALINVYGTLNVNKVYDKPINLVGLDLETNHLTAELKLLGFWIHNKYRKYTNNFLYEMFKIIKWCAYSEHHIAYWNKLDPQVLFKQFLLIATEKQQYEALSRFNKTSGQWNRKDGGWIEPPVIEVDFMGYKFGIRNVIRSSIQFFFYKEGNTAIKTVWAYDIAQLYEGHLEKEAKNRKLTYYSKVDDGAHRVDWVRYENDSNYRDNIVNHSNMLDARAVTDLGMIIQDEFKEVFGYYVKTLVSSGSLARAGIVASIFNKYGVDPTIEEASKQKDYYKAVEDIKSIAFMNHYDKWLEDYGQESLKDLFAISMESYSGGYIDALKFGYAKYGYYADISGAYPSNIRKLYDLRDSSITRGVGVPPSIKYSYCFVRGDVTIPTNVNIHPLTIKHFVNKSTNIRAVGSFRASYLKEERDYLLSLGATFENEEWVNVQTKGKLSPLAMVSTELGDMRNLLREQGNSAEYIAKKTDNSGYGIQFEAIMTYQELSNVYSKASIKNLIKVVTEFVGNINYDFKLNGNIINNIVENVLIMLNEFKTKDEISKYISNEIMSKCYAIEKVDDNLRNEFDLLRSFLSSINLSSIESELKYHYDDMYGVIKRLWNSNKGLYYDSVIEEVESLGVALYGSNNVDKLISMFDRYDNIKLNLKPNKKGIKEVFNEDDLNDIKQSLYEYTYNGLIDVNDIDIDSNGYRAGEFFNPIYASWITSQTRIYLSKAANDIERNGGEVVLLSTDSILWLGEKENMPKKYYKEIKTTGYFETPERVEDILCLGSGRYEFTDNKGRKANRQRGLNTTNWQHPDGIQTIDFSWHEALTNPMHLTDKGLLNVNVRSLISVGMVLHSPKRIVLGEEVGYDIKDLGKIVTVKREVEAVIGLSKRIPLETISTYELSKRMIGTKPLLIDSTMFGKFIIYDQTLPELRSLMNDKVCISAKQKAAKINRKSSKKFYTANQIKIRKEVNAKYKEIRKYGYSREDARRMSNWGADTLIAKYMKDGVL